VHLERNRYSVPASFANPVRTMCRLLRIHPSGFYAWLRMPLSKRASEDKRQMDLLQTAWEESGKVYGYQKLHDDLLDHGETCCPNRVARLPRIAGIKAQIGYKRRPGIYGGRPSVVIDNTLDRQFDVEAPDKAWVTDITYIRTNEGFAYLAVVIDLYYRRVIWLVDAEPSDNGCRAPSITDGCLAAKAKGKSSGAFRSGIAIHQHGLGSVPESPQSGSFDEPTGQLL
jgi:hypothetical protein